MSQSAEAGWSRAESRQSPLPEPARRLAAGSALVLLLSGVVSLIVWFCVTFQAVVTPVLLALLGAALLGPLSCGPRRRVCVAPRPCG
ncbi:hypothetical protein [Streptomyces sp. NPDC058335]|uniref:hypothetical protein n=1 Tax=Streptomyces sp. NPDC058335 TaxID=3346451 RepID=UPI003653950C